jgi:hypothetical protein
MKVMKRLHHSQMEHCECDAHEEARAEHTRLHLNLNRLRTALDGAVDGYAVHAVGCAGAGKGCDCGFTEWLLYARAALEENHAHLRAAPLRPTPHSHSVPGSSSHAAR